MHLLKQLVPRAFWKSIAPYYHFLLASVGAVVYRFPSRHIYVIGVTGTKGKSSTTELASALLEGAGFSTALSGTVHFKIGDTLEPNLYKMTMPGRFFMQRFLRRAVDAGCQYAVIEMTSEGARLHRHAFVDIDALIFTNLAPEHIESHGSYENYRNAKLSLAEAMVRCPKPRSIMVANADDPEGATFLAVAATDKYPYSLKDAEPYIAQKEGLDFWFRGEHMTSTLSGVFNLYNILAAATFAISQGVTPQAIKASLKMFQGIPGRVEKIEEGQQFSVVVDYAHTPESLDAVYKAFSYTRRICVLGSTGGGRDTSKRPRMGAIAAEHCDRIILTDEDPYDEDPRGIVDDVAEGIPAGKYEVIMDRREAIRKAISLAEPGDAVLITGKGTDPYIMGPQGSKEPWSDAEVAREELRKLPPSSQ